MIEPHGGELVDRIVSEDRRALSKEVQDAPSIHLDWSEYQELINIGVGRYSPIDGFLGQNDFLKVVNDMTLEDGTTWPLPITLDVDSDKAAELNPSTTAGLYHPDGHLVGKIDVSDIYGYNEEQSARKLFGTTERSHHGVGTFLNQEDFFVGGKISVIGDVRYNENDLHPAETRVLFKHRGWERIVGFQTRNAPHRAHEYIQKSALELVDGLLIQPKLGDKQTGDYRDETILTAYSKLIDNYYQSERVALSVFPSPMRYAGPREALFDALVRKNQGCTHFIVGRDHAGVEDYYDEFGAQRIFQQVNDVGITPLFYDYSFYCERCDGMTSEKVCPHDDAERVYPSGTKIRSLLREGKQPSEKMIRPEVANTIADFSDPFITGTDETTGEDY
ncbi:sulfate adenylyltransferase [Halomicrobium sp. IBSBa]|uniref:sulfate adenylyltransferase n=1 Tax=Halomicrobium sp. IBSBa TaxID=2778916 RepID=UPI001ABFF538|nr:sulfate adenylyltransferase [Halomicrobium sp. IBSBa]MBO4248887.1 sulfate adenylyltransferase [Halomicrobium sp. IBSBa]